MYTSDINEDDVDVEGDEDETAGDDIDDVEKVNTGILRYVTRSYALTCFICNSGTIILNTN